MSSLFMSMGIYDFICSEIMLSSVRGHNWDVILYFDRFSYGWFTVGGNDRSLKHPIWIWTRLKLCHWTELYSNSSISVLKPSDYDRKSASIEFTWRPVWCDYSDGIAFHDWSKSSWRTLGDNWCERGRQIIYHCHSIEHSKEITSRVNGLRRLPHHIDSTRRSHELKWKLEN